jgi:hypothetical protein
VSGVLERAASVFLAPPAPRAEIVALPPAVRAVVLGAPADAAPLAAAVALSLRAAARAPAALVAVWEPEAGDEGGRRYAATRAASRLAARLSADDLPATARGRLAWLALEADPALAAVEVRRASAIVEGPLVTALAGARPPELDDLVSEHDIAVVAADPESPLARAALAALAGSGVIARACAPLGRGPARRLALAGLTAPRLAAIGLAGLRFDMDGVATPAREGDES